MTLPYPFSNTTRRARVARAIMGGAEPEPVVTKEDLAEVREEAERLAAETEETIANAKPKASPWKKVFKRVAEEQGFAPR